MTYARIPLPEIAACPRSIVKSEIHSEVNNPTSKDRFSLAEPEAQRRRQLVRTNNVALAALRAPLILSQLLWIDGLIVLVVFALGAFGYAQDRKAQKDDVPPVSSDSRLVVELFASAPDIVHPIATDFDSKGRLLVVESHTHFRPTKYDGPKFDRIRMLEDTNSDGKADKFTTFFEGTTATMDIAVHPDGSVYVATRNEILRVRDTDGDGKADEKKRIAFLETTGNYPHNGLSGLTFDARGDLYFGMGENLGVPYKLIAADGSKIEGGGEGGNFFWISADGKKLRRVATGFWNPFGSCRDIFGRLFVVDNDPDASPPCRLLHVVEGGDYGFQFRYGRAGRHPFQAWNGELPGTLPFVAGTGESPCEVIAYESDGLPSEYLGDLLVPAWADHRVERYVPKVQGASVTSIRKPFIQGGKDFYPAGLSVAPDGSLFVTDWGSRSYELHGKGAVWHVRWKDVKPRVKPKELVYIPVDGAHRPERDASARFSATTEDGRRFLRERLNLADVRARASNLDALIAAGDAKVDLLTVAKNDKEPALRAMAVRELVNRKVDVSEFIDSKVPAAIRAEAISGIDLKALPKLLEMLGDSDPYLRHAAIRKLGSLPEWLIQIDSAKFKELKDPKQRIGVLLAWRASRVENYPVIEQCLADADPDVRLIAMKWVSDERLTEARSYVEKRLENSNLDPREFICLTTTLARLDDKPVNEDALAGYFLKQVHDAKSPAAKRLLALRGIPSAYAKLTTEALAELLKDEDEGIRIESLRALTERADAKATNAIRSLAADPKQSVAVRAQAVVAWSASPSADVGQLLDLVGNSDAAIGAETLRGLSQRTVTEEQKARLVKIGVRSRDFSDLVSRVLGTTNVAGRPQANDTDAWLKRLEGPADAEVGRRIFENGRVATCAKCHRVDGRGANIGPDLSLVGRNDRKWIVESILQPSAVVAPHYQGWRIDTVDGRVLTGLLVHTYLDESYYVDAKGNRFKVEAKDVADVSAAKESIMPAGLVDTLTDQEIRDLVAYLGSRK